MLSRPKVFPVSTVRRGEKIVLDDDCDEEPEDDFATVNGLVERWDMAGVLTVVAWESDEKDCSDSPEKHG